LRTVVVAFSLFACQLAPPAGFAQTPPKPADWTALRPIDGPPANPPELTTVRPGAEPVVPGIPDEIRNLIETGQFAQAIEKLEALKASGGDLARGLDTKTLAWQIEKLRRYERDYSLTRAELLDELKERMRNFNEDELDTWIEQGLVDRMRIDGQVRFAGSTVSNLFFLSADLRRRDNDESEGALQKYVSELVSTLQADHEREGKTLIDPQRYRVKMVLSAFTPAERDGQTLRCWMPYLREYDFITDLQLVEADPKPVKVAPSDARQRTVYFEKTAKADQRTTFTLVYAFTAWARVNTIDDESVQPIDPQDPALKPWLREAPHVRFSPEMQALQKEIAGDEANPARLARRFYNWISNNVRYSYAREYSSLDDIGLYCASRRAGDCGQEALAFITLCRMSGIPARWQSGWTCYPDWRGLHDWTEIHLAPYGWVPVDPYMGIWATRYMDALNRKEQIAVRDFYFGSMDAHRLPANADHSAPFNPPKKGFRSDDVDNQRGELEWADGTNLYFHEYKRSMTITPIENK
jgi:hypothetical protein